MHLALQHGFFSTVCRYLTVRDVIALAQTQKKWHNSLVTANPLLWMAAIFLLEEAVDTRFAMGECLRLKETVGIQSNEQRRETLKKMISPLSVRFPFVVNRSTFVAVQQREESLRMAAAQMEKRWEQRCACLPACSAHAPCIVSGVQERKKEGTDFALPRMTLEWVNIQKASRRCNRQIERQQTYKLLGWDEHAAADHKADHKADHEAEHEADYKQEVELDGDDEDKEEDKVYASTVRSMMSELDHRASQAPTQPPDGELLIGLRRPRRLLYQRRIQCCFLLVCCPCPALVTILTWCTWRLFRRRAR